MPATSESTSTSYRPTYADVDVSVIRQNYRAMKNAAKKPVGAVIKANAYGHGSVEVARALEKERTDFFFVATLDEAVELRKSGITQTPLLVLGWTAPVFAQIAAEHDVMLTVFQKEWLEKAEPRQPLGLHLKIDTGMNRIGIRTEEEWEGCLKELQKRPLLSVKGAFTHFATADETQENYYHQQLETWKQWKKRLQRDLASLLLFHISNSAHGYRYMEETEDLIRLGISLYGYPPSKAVEIPSSVKPALSLTSVVSHIKTLGKREKVGYGGHYTVQQASEQIATVPIGYADGIHRQYAKGGYVLIGGKKCPIVGRICMDQLMVVAEGNVKVGDEVVFIGTQGNLTITADDMANALDTISYEVLCSLTQRVTRRYKL